MCGLNKVSEWAYAWVHYVTLLAQAGPAVAGYMHIIMHLSNRCFAAIVTYQVSCNYPHPVWHNEYQGHAQTLN